MKWYEKYSLLIYFLGSYIINAIILNWMIIYDMPHEFRAFVWLLSPVSLPIMFVIFILAKLMELAMWIV